MIIGKTIWTKYPMEDGSEKLVVFDAILDNGCTKYLCRHPDDGEIHIVDPDAIGKIEIE